MSGLRLLLEHARDYRHRRTTGSDWRKPFHRVDAPQIWGRTDP